MKKKLIIVLIMLLIIMLIPINYKLKDGGSTEYKAVLYKVTKVHRLPELEYVEDGYTYYKGIIIEILGFKVYENIKLVK